MANINLYEQVSSTPNFDYIKINIASPEDIRAWSFGEVRKAETINYRTQKPEKDGLFCAKIFGPTKDYECLCGRYKRIKHRGIICDKCGVEVTVSRVRRERMGHIELAAPIAHIWFLKSPPSRISTLLDITLKDLEKILYFEMYVVIDPGLSKFKQNDLLTKEQVAQAKAVQAKAAQAKEEYRLVDTFNAAIGAEAIRRLLEDLNLAELSQQLQQELSTVTSDAKKKKLTKRLKLVEDFIGSGNKPEWMILTVLPVLPPDLRPLVPLEGGRFATSDLNDLYRKVIHRNNRLKRLKELDAPEIMVHNEERMLQEAVDALFDNGRRGKVLKGSNKRPLKSLSDMLKGKQGRFRQNLLGKRVDYSGRSVIVSGPELQLHQCGLPKKMALELYKPFIYGGLVAKGIVPTIKAARKLVDAEDPRVWDVLEEAIFEHPVLLNRAPTLHRLGIQAFEPQLIEGKAIQLHPLVCTAFNADFDGDQMAVHVPLSIEAQLEARVLMMATKNILSPANGRPIIQPDKDIVLGLYYLTEILTKQPGEGSCFANMSEVYHALEIKAVTLHTPIKFRMEIKNPEGVLVSALVNTTPGRLILWNIVPKEIDFALVNKTMIREDISALINKVYRLCGQQATATFADALKELGFKYACISGISFGMEDIIVPESKGQHVHSTVEEVKEFEQQYADGLITKGEKYNKVIDAWAKCTDHITADMLKAIENYRLPETGQQVRNVNGLNSIYMMVKSGARGTPTQTRQLGGMRGTMVKPSGEIIETPIISNFKEGLTVLEYYNSTPGARKGLIDMALRTANSGYLARRLVDVAQDCIITTDDCQTTEGIIIEPIIEGGEVIFSLSNQILGRITAVSIHHPITSELVIGAGEMIDEQVVADIDAAGVDAAKVRSVITCQVEGGLCAKCYGRDLATGNLVAVGEAVGIIAAQSISEPGTQLTMKTFHIGGTAMRGTEISSIDVDLPGTVKVLNRNVVVSSEGFKIVMSRSCEVLIIDAQGQERARYKVPYSARLLLDDGAQVAKGDRIAEWDPYTIPIITEKAGTVAFQDITEGTSARTIVDETTGMTTKVITESQKYASGIELRPHINLLDDNGKIIILSNGLEARYYLPVNAVLNIEAGSHVKAGDILAKIPRESVKSRDITGGLPRVAELFEARKPKDHSLIADTDGTIEFGKDYKSKRRIILHPHDGSADIEYMAAKNKHILVHDSEFVRKGDVIVSGKPILQDILRVMGAIALSRYMVKEIQNVYRLQAVKIDDKHVEVIIRQMLKQVIITDPGDTMLLTGEKIEKADLFALNRKTVEKGGSPAKYQEHLNGITKASLQTNSFISAAAFQETPKVLTDAAIRGAIDPLRDLKENVALGRLIPAGTGFWYKKLRANSTT